jgi:GntR family transcriptional regulator
MHRRIGYKEIADELRVKIRRGELRPGDRLPSIAALRQTHDVSQVTAERAIGLLRTEGLAVTDLGRGVFVAEPVEREIVRIKRGSRVIPRRGTPAELEQLGLEPGGYVVEVRWQYTVRVFAADEVELRNT